jgi:hypothetical protein
MKINLKNGIDQLIFGWQKDVTAIYGKPDRNYKDEDDNVIFAYKHTQNSFDILQRGGL